MSEPIKELESLVLCSEYVKRFETESVMELIRDCYYHYPESHMTVLELCNNMLSKCSVIFELIHIGASILYTHGLPFEASSYIRKHLWNCEVDPIGEITELEYILIKEGECCPFYSQFGFHVECFIPEDEFYIHLNDLDICRERQLLQSMQNVCDNETLEYLQNDLTIYLLDYEWGPDIHMAYHRDVRQRVFLFLLILNRFCVKIPKDILYNQIIKRIVK